jgi:PAS domain S-box-containing protein
MRCGTAAIRRSPAAQARAAISKALGVDSTVNGTAQSSLRNGPDGADADTSAETTGRYRSKPEPITASERDTAQCNPATEASAFTPATGTLPASELRFRQMANLLPAFVWTAGPDGRLDFANDHWYAYTGLKREHMADFEWRTVLHPEDRERWTAVHAGALLHGLPCRIEGRTRKADGTYRWFLTQADPLRDECGRIAGWIGTATDIDDLKRIEQERSQMLEREKVLRLQAEAATRSAQVANRMKDEFLATLSHELRTPLNAILGWAQTLQSGTAGPEALSRALAQIEQSAQAQWKLIDDLLNVSDIVAGRLRLEVGPMRLTPAINAVIDALCPAIEMKGIRLNTSVQPGCDAICGDPVRVQQIVWNLLANAVKFTPHGGIIEVRLENSDSQAEIRISDSGDGISPEFLPFVFDRFRQADASSRKRHGGLGLGLSIARYLTEMHGGTIEAKSAGESCGATFIVRLPMEPGAAERLRRTQAAAERAAPPSGSAMAARKTLHGLRILTVDDDRNTRDMLKEALTRAGARVEVAGSAREALEKIRRLAPDVLVSDIGMPGEDGYDLLQRVRTLPPASGGEIPAVALTGYARDEDRAATRRAGYQAMAPKPVNLRELISTIAAVARQPVRA